MVMYFTKADNEISENMYYEQTLLRIKQVSTGIATTTTTTKALQRRTPYQWVTVKFLYSFVVHSYPKIQENKVNLSSTGMNVIMI